MTIYLPQPHTPADDSLVEPATPETPQEPREAAISDFFADC
jgi:hypothetical protein